MSEETLLAAVLDSPGDDTPRLVYADWLEERGDPRAEFLRVECEFLQLPPDDERTPALRARLHELHQALDPDWVTLVGRVPGNPLDELRRVLPPPRRPLHAGGDWGAVEAAIGLRLPTDYKAFIDTYGSGTIGPLEFVSPLGVGADVRRWWANWAGFYPDIAEYGIEIPYPVFPQPGRLLPFGTLGTVDLLNWLTVGEPNSWPFVYYDRDEGFFEVKGLTAVEFILEAVTQRSPLLIRLGSESAFAPPCDFEACTPEPRHVELVHPREVDIDLLACRLAARWPVDRVRVRRGESGVRLLVEPLAGTIGLYRAGDPRTWVSVHYDHCCAGQAEEVVGELLPLGFTVVSRG
jgi:uncharacterized protein (TIGR02996 family)